MGRFLRLNPKLKQKIKIAARKSDLARLQAYRVGQAIKKKFKNYKIEYSFRESLGDRNLVNPLWQMPEKGVFTQDFKDELIQGRADLVVHSWKDLPIEDTSETIIAATLRRADERDVLLFKKEYLPKDKQLPQLKIFSSSPRRAYNLTSFFSWSLPFKPGTIEFIPVRGNIQTRIQKMIESKDIHGIIVAKAALDRLLDAKEAEFSGVQRFLKQTLKKVLFQVIPLSQSPTSAAQGALAVEVSKKNKKMISILNKINCHDSYELVKKERQDFKHWGGGCHQKMGVSLKDIETKDRKSIRVKFERGLDQKNQFIWNHEVISSVFFQPNNKIAKTEIVEVNGLFNKQITELKPYQAKKNDFLVVTKSNLLDNNSSKEINVWTSGIETWQGIASLGYWVMGSYDSLGEYGRPEVDRLLGVKTKWKKLTHKNGHGKTWAKKLVLYKVDYSGFHQLEPFRDKTYFYWSHGDLFLNCLKQFPWLKKKKHICGLGSTLNTVAKHINRNSVVPVYNFKDWKKKWTQ